MEIGPMAVSGEGKQDLRGVSRLKPAEVDDREDIPLTCLLHLWLNGIHGSPPPPRRSAASVNGVVYQTWEVLV